MAATIKLSKAQAGLVDWALGPMGDYWCSADGARERDGLLYSDEDLPKMDGQLLQLSPVIEINGDLIYRIEVQMPDMATSRRSATLKMCERLAAKIRSVNHELRLMPYGGGYL